MKEYTITVNGVAYDVTIEEKESGSATPAPSTAVMAVPPKKSTGAGSIPIKSGTAGKVYKIVASVGQEVKKGDAVIIIEAMKMEISVVAPQDGVVASIDCAAGDNIESGALLATLK